MNLEDTPSARLRRTGPACLVAGALALLTAPAVTVAQSVRPVIVEYKGQARGKVEVVNDSLFPINVVLEPKSFDINEAGQGLYRSLDPSIHLKLSAMSFRIPPQQSRYAFYEAASDTLPAWFVLTCTFSGLPQQAGLNIQLELPHTVYMVQKDPLGQGDVNVQSASFQSAPRRVGIRIQNVGPNLGRVVDWQVSSAQKTKHFAGFPLLPKNSREMQGDWDATDPPNRFEIRFQHFTIKQSLPLSSP